MCHGENKFLSFDDIVVIVKSKFEVVVNISTNINTYHLKSSSEWLLLNANSAIFQQYHGESKLIFNEMMMKSALY
jgi:hypothetical protein